MAETLRDFLIGYGFKVDETSRRQAEAAVRKSEVDVTNLTDVEASKRERIRRRENERQDRAERDSTKKSEERRKVAFGDYEKALLRFTGISTAIGAVTSLTAAGIFNSIQKVAGGLEQLQYAGQRTGAAPKSISAFAYGISQLGGSVEGASASLEQFGQRLALNPQGYEQILRQIGVRTRNTAGEIRDSAELAQDALQALGKRPINEARNYADSLGFDDITRRAGSDPRLSGLIAQRRSEQARIGFDPNQAAKDATAFEQSRRHLTAVLDDVATKIGGILIEKLQPQLERLAQWVANHGASITTVAQRVSDAIGQMATAFAESGAFQSSVRGITSGLESFAKFVASDDFSKDVKAFTEGVGRLARAVIEVLKYFNLLPGAANASPAAALPGVAPNGMGSARLDDAFERGGRMKDSHIERAANLYRRWTGQDRAASGKGGWWTPERQAHAYAKLRAGGLSDIGAKALVSRWSYVESPNGPSSSNNLGGGHIGIAQWGGRRKYGVTPDFDQQLDKAIEELHSTEKQAFNKLNSASSIAEGAVGASMFERAEGYNPVTGEDSFTGATAAGMHRVATEAPKPPPFAPPSTVAERVARAPRLPPGAIAWGKDSKGNPVPIGADGHALTMNGKPTSLAYPLGVTPSMVHSVDNSRTKGDTNVTHNPTYNISGTANTTDALSAARLSAGRGIQDLLRDIQGSGQ